MADPYRLLDEIEEGFVRKEDQHRMLQALVEHEGELKEEFNRTLSCGYPPAARLLVIEADTFQIGVGFTVSLYSDPYTPVPSGDLAGSGSVTLHRHLDKGALKEAGVIGNYVVLGAELFTLWMARMVPELSGYKEFPLRIGLRFRGESECYDVITEEPIDM
ncbi:hypothetical protein [Micromonospora sp. NPDC002717]|uniref:hypothetical protein n=1 Tax=Micromonospora sp. NPDC002717 TaxID=3154424 RepID=UPI003327182C